jgi:hypothetical protein
MTDVDDELRALFERKAREVPSHSEVPPALRRRSRVRIASTSAVALVVVLVLGGGVVGALQLVNRAGRGEPGGGGSGMVASTSPPPATGAALPRCTSGQVRVDASLGGAMGSVEGAILVSNYSSTRCTLQGYPGLTLLGADLSPVAGQNRYGVRRTEPQWQANALPTPAGWPVVTLKPGAAASIRFRWSNWCGTGNAATPLWKIRIPGSGEAPVYGMDGTQPPPCNGPGLPSTIWIGPFEPARALPR